MKIPLCFYYCTWSGDKWFCNVTLCQYTKPQNVHTKCCFLQAEAIEDSVLPQWVPNWTCSTLLVKHSINITPGYTTSFQYLARI